MFPVLLYKVDILLFTVSDFLIINGMGEKNCRPDVVTCLFFLLICVKIYFTSLYQSIIMQAENQLINTQIV